MLRQLLVPRYKLNLIHKVSYTTNNQQVNFRQGSKRLLRILIPEKRNIALATGCLLISSGITMSVPFSLGKMLDLIFDKKDQHESKLKLQKLCGALGIVFLIGGFANFARIYLFNTASLRIVNRLRGDLYKKIMSQELGWFETNGPGKLVHRLAIDTYLVGNSLSQNLSDGLRSTIMLSIGTGMMFYTSPTLTLISVLVCPFLAGLAIVNGRFIKKMTKQIVDKNADISKNVEEALGNIKTVKQFSKESFESLKYDKFLNDLMALSYKEIKAKSAFFGMAGFTGNFIIISVLYYGGNLVITDSLSIGELTSFVIYTAYTAISINGISTFYTELNKGLGSSERLWEIMDRVAPVSINQGHTPVVPAEGNIIFENVSFRYPSRPEITILRNLNLVLEANKSYAIVGKSGSGKSTVANLILRLYDSESGVIKLDNNDIKSLNPVWLRSCIGAVPQEPVLFSGSIRENIVYSLPDGATVDEAYLNEILKLSSVDEFVINLPNGLDTVVGQRGVMLSGGQKQRIAIARALINNPKILIFDEATSALDTITEEMVQQSIDEVKKGRTLLTIAHRLSTIRNMDEIIVLDNGLVRELGSYDELTSKPNGYFKNLVKNQAFIGD